MGMREQLGRAEWVHFDWAFWALFALSALSAIGAILDYVSALVVVVTLSVAAGVYKVGEVLRTREMSAHLERLGGRMEGVGHRVGEVGMAVEKRYAEHREALERAHWDLAKKAFEHRERTEDLHKLVVEKHEEQKEHREKQHRGLVQRLAVKRVKKQLDGIEKALGEVQGKLEARNVDHQKALEMTYRDLARKIIDVENRLNQTAKVLKAAGESAGQ